MNLQEAVEACPHLLSPAALAYADTAGKFKLPPHLAYLNRLLMETWATPDGRLAVNMPFQHGKSWLCSHYFPAWVLLLWPETRIALASYEERYSGTFGSKVRAVIDRFGGPHGVTLRQDTHAKNEWVIKDHGGGMVCKGRHGALTGRPADLLILDDTIKDAEEALSTTILDGIWDWYSTVAYSRLGPTAPIVNVGTRWVSGDLFGRIADEAKHTGEQWKTVKFRAIAGSGDPLGRQAGQALWPERVPLERLEMIRQQRGRWFSACWQQEPVEDAGMFFRPDDWPLFWDLGDAWRAGGGWPVTLHADCWIFSTVDWAKTEKDTSDFTAIGVFALTPDYRLLILEVVNERIADKTARVLKLANLCRRWNVDQVVGEDDVLSEWMASECERNRFIPTIRRLSIQSRSKTQRAEAAILWGENKRIFRPSLNETGLPPAWWDMLKTQLSAFTGVQKDHDDLVDVMGIACRVAEERRRTYGGAGDDYGVEAWGGKEAW